MRKISELTGDEFFDVIYALSPVLPMIGDMEIVQTQLFGNHSKEISEARATITANKVLLEKGGNPSKNQEYQKNINEAERIIKTEISNIFARDISKIIPFLASKENRGCMFNALSILEKLPVEEIKQYPAPKLLSKIKTVIKDADFKSFLDYAEKSDTAE